MNVPPIEEEKDLLIEHVQGQDALDRVALHVTENSDLEVAHSDSGKVSLKLISLADYRTNH